MNIPNTLTVVASVECNNCVKTVSVDGPMRTPASLMSALKTRLLADGWQPVSVGSVCIGVMCPKCVSKCTSENDETETENRAEENRDDAGDEETT